MSSLVISTRSASFFYSLMSCVAESVQFSMAFPAKRLNFLPCVSHAQTKVLWPWRVSGRELDLNGESLWRISAGGISKNDYTMFDTSQFYCPGVQVSL